MNTEKFRLVTEPSISLNRLADYMAASEQAKRTILTSCKFQPRARVIQHNEAKLSIAQHVVSARTDVADLEARSQQLRHGLADSDFTAEQNEHNADFIDKFVQNKSKIGLHGLHFAQPGATTSTVINGTVVRFNPELIVRRVTTRNTVKHGAVCLRYRKNNPLSPAVGEWQSSFLFGYFVNYGNFDEGEPDKAICLTVDVFAGVKHPAPGKAIYNFKEISAALAGIAERWASIEQPASA